MFDAFWTADTVRAIRAVSEAADKRLTDINFIRREIDEFKGSRKRAEMIIGERYYRGEHKILGEDRNVIGPNGELEPVKNLPNNRKIDNQYKKMVNQKANYLLGNPFTFKCQTDAYTDTLKNYFDKSFMRLLKNIGKDALNCSVGWILVYYNESGELRFKRIKNYEVIPYWADAEHTILQGAIRFYGITSYEGNTPKDIEKVEVYDQNGVWYYSDEPGTLTPEAVPYEPYFIVTEGAESDACNWTRIPLIPFKYNSDEIPLIRNVKSLQDGLNRILSNFQNSMEEDTRNTILVLVNYDGQNLGEFRRNLATYGAVKVRNDSQGAGGDVKTLQVEVNAENYKAIIELFKRAIIENAMGYDAKDDRMSGSPNQMNILSMYSDIDLDANDMETEFQASMEHLLWFIDAHLEHIGKGDFDSQQVEVIFNRDILMNEGDIISNCQNSTGILSDETIIANHPWVDDPKKELERLKKQKEESIDMFGFPPDNSKQPGGDPSDGEEE